MQFTNQFEVIHARFWRRRNLIYLEKEIYKGFLKWCQEEEKSKDLNLFNIYNKGSLYTSEQHLQPGITGVYVNLLNSDRQNVGSTAATATAANAATADATSTDAAAAAAATANGSSSSDPTGSSCGRLSQGSKPQT